VRVTNFTREVSLKTFTAFRALGLPAPLHAALESLRFITPTAIQAQSIPPALEGKDILGTAQTGTGKTGAFGIPLLAKLYRNPGTRALVLAPTRELAAQIHKVLGEMGGGMNLKGALLVGGEPFLSQKQQVKAGADYYVGTPGRLLDHLDAGLKLSMVRVLVLDEVDRMLDMGFTPQLMQILPRLPMERQTLLFSATLPKEILPVVSGYLRNSVRVSVGATTQPHDRVTQENHATTHLNKNDLLLRHLKDRKGKVLIFARTQRRANKVYQVLQRNRLAAALLHGGRTQKQRTEALDSFRSGTHPFLVATDLAGRGIDVSDIEVVINYDLPTTREAYIHRIGRTARNGKTGSAFNYLTAEDREGSGIIGDLQPRPGLPLPPAAPKANKPGAPKGGWESRGGRNKPAFRKRTAAEGYGRGFEPPTKRRTGVSGKPRVISRKRSEEHARAKKLGIAVKRPSFSPRAQENGASERPPPPATSAGRHPPRSDRTPRTGAPTAPRASRFHPHPWSRRVKPPEYAR